MEGLAVGLSLPGGVLKGKVRACWPVAVVLPTGA